jgi:hypothetical protein
MHAWWLLIRLVSLPWTGDVMDPGDACVAALHLLSLNYLDQGCMLFFLFLVLNTRIQLCIATCEIC